MNSNWKRLKLGDFLEEVDLRYKDLIDEEQKNIQVLSLTKDHGLIPQSERFLKQIATSDLTKYKVVKEGWIAYNPYVIWEGAIHILRNRQNGLVSPAYVIWRVKNGDLNFIDYLLKSPLLINKYLRVATGTVKRRRAVKKSAFEAIDVNMPNMESQSAIGNLLNTIQKSIESRLKELQFEKEYKELLLTDIFTKGLQNGKTKDSLLGEIPLNWKTIKLGDTLVKTQYGLSLKGSATEGKYPYLRMNNLIGGYVVPNKLQYVDVPNNILENYRLNKGDLLFNRTNSFELVGKTGIFNLPDEYVFASYLVRLIPNREIIIPEYLNTYLNWNITQKRLKTLATRGVSQSNINATKLSNLIIHFPSIQEQEQIADLTTCFDNKFRELEKEVMLLKELFSTILEESLQQQININLLRN